MPRTASMSPYFLVSALTEMAGVTPACPPPRCRRLPRGYGTGPCGCRPGSCWPAAPGPASRLGRPELIGVRLDVRAALVGQRVVPAPVLARRRGDQALILQLLQRRVDRPRA